MNVSKRIVVTGSIGCIPILLGACNPAGSSGVDMSPVGSGLQFLGIAVVLATLIVVFGRFIGR